jgi:bisphosphoglycerate-dependent phosphoglycerate mutase
VCNVLARAAGVMLLQKYNLKFHMQNARIRCVAHVVNLSVQALLTALHKADDPEMNNYYIPNKHLPFHYDLNNNNEV